MCIRDRENIFERKSVRTYLNKGVEKEKIDLLLRAGMAAPSGHAVVEGVWFRNGNYSAFCDSCGLRSGYKFYSCIDLSLIHI